MQRKQLNNGTGKKRKQLTNQQKQTNSVVAEKKNTVNLSTKTNEQCGNRKKRTQLTNQQKQTKQ